MFFSYMVLLGSLVNLLLDSPASFVAGCDRNCTDKPEFHPPSVVVEYGDPFSANCSVCQTDCIGSYFGLEVRLGVKERNGTILSWKVDKMTQWSSSAKCYYNDVKVPGHQCCADLPIMVYRAPDNVSLRILNHTELLIEGNQYTLECMVQNVAPVKYLVVTFYKGSTALSQMRSNNTKVTLVNENFFLNINSSKEDDGVQYHCAAELNLGIEPHPPVIRSQRISVTVHYMPRLVAPSNPDPVDVKEGHPLELNCSAVGQPSPSYIWTLPNGVTSHTNDSVLTIDSATTEDTGEYTCIANNIMGSVTVSFSVKVQANIIGIILTVILIVVAVLTILGVAMYCSSYMRNRTGTYSFLRPFLSRN